MKLQLRDASLGFLKNMILLMFFAIFVALLIHICDLNHNDEAGLTSVTIENIST